MTAKRGSILIVDDDPDVLVAARMLLKQNDFEARTELDPYAIPELLRDISFDAILLDMNFSEDASSGREGFYWLNEIHALDPDAVVILITAYGDVEMAVQAMNKGATDFVLKPWQNEKLLATVSAAVDLHRSRLDAARLRSRRRQLSADLDQPFGAFIGASAGMREVYDTITRVAGTDASVLILGENGSGKELVAREIHRRSSRADEVFVTVDMGAISETLFESELFGHVRGAFTDARADRAGRFEVASGGTLFLDEIGNLPLSQQAKLLVALENRQVVRVGANKPIDVDVRLICATNRPIHQMVAAETFRQDLLFRINTVEVHVPPLHQRPGDIVLLVDHFLNLLCRKYSQEVPTLTAAAVDKLRAYRWPGNVRELQHAIERALIMSEGAEFDADDFLLAAPKAAPRGGPEMASYQLEDVEKAVIEHVLRQHGGNVSHAARELGLSRTSLYRRMEKYGL